MKSLKHVFAVSAMAVFLTAGLAMAQQKLVYDGEGSDIAPRSGLKSVFNPASAEVEAARKNTNLPVLLQFNRLHKPEKAPNLHPTLDGLHDPDLGAVQNEILPPETGMKGITPNDFGNRVDWVQGLLNAEIAPVSKVYDGADDQEVNMAEIIIPAVGFTPDVVFPHRAHTIWLACSNCHESQTFEDPFFEPAAGENHISMNEIVQGKWCGWCHSGTHEKVAFPLTDCMRCHSGPLKKTPTKIKQYMIDDAKLQAGVQ